MYFVILAEGLGTRLIPYTLELPKVLLPVGEKTILDHQIDWIYRYSREKVRVLVMTSYLRDKIHQHIKSHSFPVDVEDLPSEQPSGTSGAVLRAKDHLQGDFYVVNGDILTDINYNDLQLRERLVAIASIRMRSPYGVLKFKRKSDLWLVERFLEKSVIDQWINAGIYHFHNRVFDYMRPGEDLEINVFPSLASAGQIVAYRYYNKFWISIDSEKDWKEAQLQYCKLLHPERYTGKTIITSHEDKYTKENEINFDQLLEALNQGK